MFSMHGDEILSLVLNMECFLVRGQIDNLKQSVVTEFFKEDKRRKLYQFLLFLSNFSENRNLDRSNFFLGPVRVRVIESQL